MRRSSVTPNRTCPVRRLSVALWVAATSPTCSSRGFEPQGLGLGGFRQRRNLFQNHDHGSLGQNLVEHSLYSLKASHRAEGSGHASSSMCEFTPAYADHGDQVRIKASWAKVFASQSPCISHPR